MADSGAVTVAIAMGSNQGDRVANLRRALAEMESRGVIADARASHAYETPPEGAGDGGPFANAAVSGLSRMDPRDLLESLLAIESTLGRVRVPGRHGGPRVIDLDLVLHGDAVIDEPGLSVPHPRFARRAFVLVPLAEIAPDLVEPRSGRPLHSLLAALAPQPLPRLGSLRK